MRSTCSALNRDSPRPRIASGRIFGFTTRTTGLGLSRTYHPDSALTRFTPTFSPVRVFFEPSFAEMESLFRRYEAGTIDLGTFLLAHQWNEVRKSDRISPELVRASVAFLDAVSRAGDRRLLRHYYKAISFLRAYAEIPQRRRTVDYAEWWKLRALLFMLQHPRESYRTRDLRAHLASLGLAVSSLDLRRFCTRHGIRRDMRAGRPRTRA